MKIVRLEYALLFRAVFKEHTYAKKLFMIEKTYKWLLSLGLFLALINLSAEIHVALNVLESLDKWRSLLGLVTVFAYLIIFFAGLATLWIPKKIHLPETPYRLRWLVAIFLLSSTTWFYLYSPIQNALTDPWMQLLFAAGITSLIARILDPDSDSPFDLSHLILILSLFLYPRIVQEMRNLSSQPLVYRLVTLGGVVLIIGLVVLLFSGGNQKIKEKLVAWRDRLGKMRWPLVAFFLLLPLLYRYLFGVETYVLYPSLRFLVLLVSFWGMAYLIETGSGRMFRLEAVGLSVGALVIVSFLIKSLMFVTNYPFMLYWSEGNRFYDYSLMFGQDLYNYPGAIDNPYSSPGRYGLWGVLFLWQGLPIWVHRLWNVVLQIVLPFLLAFFLTRKMKRGLLRTGLFLWIFVFFTEMVQVHMPFMLVGIIVAAFAFEESPLRRGLALSVASFYAGLSRWTQIWAPGAWGVLIDILFFYPKRKGNWINRILPTIGQALFGMLPGLLLSARSYFNYSSGVSTSSKQPLLWYRLLPNETLGPGILLAALMVSGPPLAILIWQILSERWKLDWLQKLAVGGALAGFLAVGLVISTKIGGGADLHNLDMFLVTLVFLIVLSLYSRQENFNLRSWPLPAQILIWLMMLMPVMSFTPFSVDAATSFRLDIPKQKHVDKALEIVSSEVQIAAQSGEVLFIDQRQLLTFGYVDRIPLVPEYEKKYMMDQAMGNNQAYFIGYYQDLADQNFALIVSEPLKTSLKTEVGGPFPDENDAWTTWVVKPTLCFYEPIYTSKSVNIQLLVPRKSPTKCEKYLP